MIKLLTLVALVLLVSSCSNKTKVDEAIIDWKRVKKSKLVEFWERSAQEVRKNGQTVSFLFHINIEGANEVMESTDNDDCEVPGHCQALAVISMSASQSCSVSITFDDQDFFLDYFALPGCKEEDIPKLPWKN